MRRGAAELNLHPRWRRHFVPPGTVAESTAGAVLLDVGGGLGPGVLDSHQGGVATTAQLVVRHPEFVYGHLMGAWLRRFDDGQDLVGRSWSPVLVTHRAPDFDCVVSSFLVEALIEHGVFPPYAEALAAYTAEVDTGRYSLDLSVPDSYTGPVHMAYLMLQGLQHELTLDDESLLELGITMVRAVCEALLAARAPVGIYDFTPHRLPAGSLGSDALAGVKQAALAWQQVVKRHPRLASVDLPTRLAQQPGLFEEDRLAREQEDRRVGRAPTARLPAADGGDPIEVRVWVAPGATRCVLNKYFVRAAGFPYFICPIPGGAGGSAGAVVGRSGRVVISLEPGYFGADDRKPTLRGLGYRLERAEREVRENADPRIPVPRWHDETATNDDPWYDGRGHGHTIVDSPRCGTALSDAEIVQIATRGDFWKTPLEAAQVFVVVVDSGTAGTQRLPTRPLVGLASAVELWRSRSVDAARNAEEPRRALPKLPPHFVRDREFLRIPPEELTVDGRRPTALGVVSIVAGPDAKLDDLAVWVEQVAGDGDLLHVVAVVNPERNAGWSERTSQLLSQMCLGDPEQIPRHPDEKMVLNGRIVALNRRSSRQHDHYVDALSELMLYAAFQESVLRWFSDEIANTVESRRNSSGLRQAFLLFRTQYLCPEPALTSDARRAYHAVVAALGLGEELDKVSQEMLSLAEIDEDREAERRDASDANRSRDEAFLNGVLGVVAAAGIIEAVGIDWGAMNLLQWVVIAVGVGLSTALIVPRVRRLMIYRSQRGAAP